MTATAISEATAGVAGGLLSAAIVYPLELAKNRLQLQTEGQLATRHNGVAEAIAHTYKHEGLAGLFQGIKGEFTKESVKNFSTFFWYAQFKHFQRAYNRRQYEQTRSNNPALISEDNEAAEAEERIDLLVTIILGIAASTLTVLAINPLSVATIRMQSRTASAPDVKYGVIRTMVYLARKNGILSFYGGVLPALFLTLNPAIQLAVFDKLQQLYLNRKRANEREKRRRQNELQHEESENHFQLNNQNEVEMKHEIEVQESEITLNSIENFVIGAIAKSIATVVTYPYILAKMRLQFQSDDPKAPVFNGAMRVIYHILKTEGFLGIYQGLQPQLIKSVISSGVVYMTKEKISLYSDGAVNFLIRILNKLRLI